jgi:spermidine synthase
VILIAWLAGAASLCFEVLWARRLSLEAGSPLAAFTIVVCVFMAGMAAGAALFGVRASRIGRPLRAFGWLQVAACVPALVLALPAAAALIRAGLRASGAEPGSAGFLALMALLGTGALFLSSVAMGGVTPLLVEAWTREGREPRTAYARLAAAQAAGGAAGALTCGFALLPRLGLSRSLLAAAVAALAGGALALWRSPGAGARGSRPAPAPPDAVEEPAVHPALVAMSLLACGLSLTALEVVWTRLAALSFGSSAQAGSLVLAAAIFGLAAGNLLGPRLLRRRGGAPALALSASAASLAVVLTDPLLGRLPLAGAWLARAVAPGGELATAFVALFVITALPCVFVGAAFPAGFAALNRGGIGAGSAAGVASACSSIGTCLGAPLAWLALEARLGVRGCLVAAAVLLGLAGATVAGRARAGVAGAVAVALALGLGAFAPWDLDLLSSGPFLYGSLYGWAQQEGVSLREALRARGPVLYAREGPEALVTVRRGLSGTLSMQVNGKTDASTGGDMKTQILVAQVPLLLRAAAPGSGTRPPRTLVIGLGSGVSAGSALTHGGTVDVLEISREVVDAAAWFAPDAGAPLDNPRLALSVVDARSHLLFGGGASWDVIVSQPSNPWVAGQASLFTREFFMLERDRLTSGGIVCQWLQGYGLRAEDFRSVVATFTSVFPEASLWEESTAGGDYLLVGSAGPLRIDAARLARALARPDVQSDLARIDVRGPADLLAHYVAGPLQLADLAAGAALQTEDRLALEFTAPRALREETLGGILRVLEPHRVSPATLVPGDAELAAALEREARAGREERRWAAGLGLFEAEGIQDPELLHALAFLRAGMRRPALDAVRAVAARHPREALPRMILAHLAMAQGHAGEAAAALADAVAAEPGNARARLFLARALFAAGRLPSALAVNDDVRRLDPDSVDAVSDACAMRLAAGDDQAAAPFCERAAAEGSIAEALANLGVLRAREGRFDEARSAYDAALARQPDLQDARYNLAALAWRQGLEIEGLRALEPLLEGAPDVEVMLLAARLAARSGDAAGARHWMERARALDPQAAGAVDPNAPP